MSVMNHLLLESRRLVFGIEDKRVDQIRCKLNFGDKSVAILATMKTTNLSGDRLSNAAAEPTSRSASFFKSAGSKPPREPFE